MTGKFGYELNYDWKHSWPRAPIPTNEQERLEELQHYAILDTPAEDKFDKLCRIACKEMKCPIAAVSFIDKHRQWFKANSGLTQRQIPRDVALCAHTIMNPKKALIVEDTTQDERFEKNPLVTRASSVKFYAGVPITTPKGYAIGSIFVFDVKVHHDVDVKILHRIASKVIKYMEERLKTGEAKSGDATSSSSSDKAHSKRHSGGKSTAQKARNENSENVAPPSSNVGTPAPSSQSQSHPTASEKQTAASGTSESHAPPTTTQPNGESEGSTGTSTNGSLVPSQNAVANANSTSNEMEVSEGGLGNMGTMLMNLLARTTETQQQLAAQQGVMFETLGQHSQQLASLDQSLSHLEKRIDTVKSKR